MTYKLKANESGKVKFLLRAGKDLVSNTMDEAGAKGIVYNGEVTLSDIPDYLICVDNKWYFEGAINNELDFEDKEDKEDKVDG
jgi:hypothetical protein|nr:MAG TPA: hypothetical protein [Caudoviricetes sp.]